MGGLLVFLIWVAVIVFEIASLWIVFTKAGQPGWAAIIPIYNCYVLLKVAGMPGWWLILFFIPFVNLVIAIITYIALAAKFGKGVGFGIGLFLLWFIFCPILAFSDAKYQAVPAASAPPARPPT